MPLTIPLSSREAVRLVPAATFEEYLRLTDGLRAEWVGGMVKPMEPPSEEHENTSGFLSAIGRIYVEETDAGRVLGDGYTERVAEDRSRIPDVAFFKKANLGKITRTHAIGGADLIIEVASPSTRQVDRTDKFAEYEAAGVEEYWMVDPERRSAEFYRLSEGRYVSVLPDAEGRVHSSTIPGFYLRVSWLWERPKVTTVLRELGVL